MEKSKLSAKSLLKEISYKKHLKNKKMSKIGELSVCKADFEIENLNLINSPTDSKFTIDKEIAYKNLKNLLDNTSSCQISDALSKIAKRSGVIEGVKSINKKTAYGRVVTVKTSSDDWGTSLLGIDEAKKGNILVIKTIGPISAIWGELTSSCSQEKELAGTVIIGATRDIDFVSEFEYPVFASKTTPNAGTAAGLGSVNIPLKIGKDEDLIIKPGDFIFADKSGVVHIPQELFCEVMIKTLEIKINETNILSEIEKGKSLSEIVGLK
ncbi:RraA family protein [Methanobrevibacter sp. TMH8]|uniref:RraA family protein n=1 Tax=Methanobrevibacter sp. TMH8 TaxID=2848611 RepID=UPI001CD00469|nr:RraA family protein [Methanobrevibacter sp. TMH8]MBZ9570344.1 RraA family protein [Methanobrevibacter sp. TMH8]